MIGSDMAADAGSDLLEAVLQVLESTFKRKSNKFNTHGCVNAACLLDELIFPASDGYHSLCEPKLYKFVEKVKVALAALMDESRKLKWDDAEDKRYHLVCYSELHDKCKVFLAGRKDE